MNSSANYPSQNKNNTPANTTSYYGGNYSNYANTITYHPISPQKANHYQPPPAPKLPQTKPKESFTSYQQRENIRYQPPVNQFHQPPLNFGSNYSQNISTSNKKNDENLFTNPALLAGLTQF